MILFEYFAMAFFSLAIGAGVAGLYLAAGYLPSSMSRRAKVGVWALVVSPLAPWAWVVWSLRPQP